jgi:hypothetical protein
MKKKDVFFLLLGGVGLLSLFQAHYLYYEKKISSVANANGLLIITLANFDENQNAYQMLSDMFGSKAPLSGHINNIHKRKKEIQNQFYLFLSIGVFLIGTSLWLFFSTYKTLPKTE